MEEACACKKKHRSEEERTRLIQCSAVNAALNAFERELLAAHIRTCVAEDLRSGDDAVVDELMATLQKLMR